MIYFHDIQSIQLEIEGLRLIFIPILFALYGHNVPQKFNKVHSSDYIYLTEAQ